jgi:hypothetical protein
VIATGTNLVEGQSTYYGYWRPAIGPGAIAELALIIIAPAVNPVLRCETTGVAVAGKVSESKTTRHKGRPIEKIFA